MELEFVRWLSNEIPAHPAVALGIGDDAAVLRVPKGREVVVATDMLTDGTHFQTRDHLPGQIGYKSLAANLSDLAAMAAAPLAAFVALNLPARQLAADFANQLIAGMLPLAERHGCPIAGGDTNLTEGPLVVSVTVLGTVLPGKAWRRSGAQPGDRILVTGSLGGSLSGRHLDFEPRVTEALWLCENFEIHAAMDISDGLSIDLSRMLHASGVGAIVDVERVPISPAGGLVAAHSKKTPLQHALGDGEDFELILAVPPAVAERLTAEQPLACKVTDLGEFTAEAGLRQQDANGVVTPLHITGYQHRE